MFRIETFEFRHKYEFFEKCPPLKGAMGDDQLYSRISIWTIFNF